MADNVRFLDTALIVWFALTIGAVLYTAWDIRSTPEMKIMKPGWIMVVLFTGPIGAALYVLSCKEPSPGTHEKFVQPLWKQAVGSTIHCLAGDATGIIAAAVVMSLIGGSMLIHFLVEYAFGFVFGLLIFQAIFMRQMMKTTYARAVRDSFMPELVSMNCVMAGMGATMLILMSRHMSAMNPASIRFWGVMSLASLVGMIASYPVNLWLVAAGLKHGMGTELVLGEAGTDPHAAMASMKSGTTKSHPGKSATTQPHTYAVTLLSFLALGGGLLLSSLLGYPSMEPGVMQMPPSP